VIGNWYFVICNWWLVICRFDLRIDRALFAKALNYKLQIRNYKSYNFHRVADFGKLFSMKAKTFAGAILKIGSLMLRGSILYFFM
jgi:hypothetical protein